MRILVAGATGRLGMRLVRRFRGDGHHVRVLVRDPRRLGLLRHQVNDVVQGDLTTCVPPEACHGIDLVFSCASASTRLLDAGNESSFESVNHYGNLGLLRAALRARVERFIYVAPLGAEHLAHTAYGGAHERFVELLERSPLDHTVIRPTAYFEYVDEAVTLLRAGHAWTLGEGAARTNPIHEADLADFCARALDRHVDQLCVGGPGTFTRSDIAELARHVVQRAGAPRLHGGLPVALRLTNRRVRELLEFSAEISRFDILGEPHGRHDLRRHLSALSGAWRPGHAAALSDLPLL